jgi:hypothetical protein
VYGAARDVYRAKFTYGICKVSGLVTFNIVYFVLAVNRANATMENMTRGEPRLIIWAATDLGIAWGELKLVHC